MNRSIRKEGLTLIKQFEGCRLSAYQDAVNVWTIGYGHTGSDVYKGLEITQEQANEFLEKDCEKFAKTVDSLGMNLNDNQRDALISFSFNCGEGNLRRLCKGRTNEQIAEHIVFYNKAGGKVLSGLTRRRNAERDLWLKPISNKEEISMTQYEELKQKICQLEKNLATAEPMIYHYTSSLPLWAKASVQKALDKGYIFGASDGDLNLSEEMIRILVILDRIGIF